MPKKTFTPEQIVAKLRHMEVLLSQGKTVPLACKEAGIVDQTYYRWRKEFGGLQLEQAKKLKDLQKENAQLKRALATVTLEKQVLKDIAEGNVWSAPLLQA
jgi:putative transposase